MKRIVTVLAVLFAMASGAFALERSAGLFLGGSLQAEPTEGSYGGGMMYGGEFGLIFDGFQLWSRLLVDMEWTDRGLLIASANPGLELVLGQFGIAAGAVLRSTMDRNSEVATDIGTFYESSFGAGPFLELSYIIDIIREWLVLRPGLSADYVFQSGGPDQFRVRAFLCLHLRSGKF